MVGQNLLVEVFLKFLNSLILRVASVNGNQLVRTRREADSLMRRQSGKSTRNGSSSRRPSRNLRRNNRKQSAFIFYKFFIFLFRFYSVSGFRSRKCHNQMNLVDRNLDRKHLRSILPPDN